MTQEETTSSCTLQAHATRIRQCAATHLGELDRPQFRTGATCVGGPNLRAIHLIYEVGRNLSKTRCQNDAAAIRYEHPVIATDASKRLAARAFGRPQMQANAACLRTGHIHPRGQFEPDCHQHEAAIGCRRHAPRIRTTTPKELPTGCTTHTRKGPVRDCLCATDARFRRERKPGQMSALRLNRLSKVWRKPPPTWSTPYRGFHLGLAGVWLSASTSIVIDRLVGPRRAIDIRALGDSVTTCDNPCAGIRSPRRNSSCDMSKS